MFANGSVQQLIQRVKRIVYLKIKHCKKTKRFSCCNKALYLCCIVLQNHSSNIELSVEQYMHEATLDQLASKRNESSHCRRGEQWVLPSSVMQGSILWRERASTTSFWFIYIWRQPSIRFWTCTVEISSWSQMNYILWIYQNKYTQTLLSTVWAFEEIDTKHRFTRYRIQRNRLPVRNKLNTWWIRQTKVP